LIDAAGCPSDTFRAWRNRNGLFPETQNLSNKWNRFSFVDVMIAAIVTDLTKRGFSAQLAVDAAMASAPLLEELSDAAAIEPDAEVLTVVAALLTAWKKHKLPVLAIDSELHRRPEVRLIKPTDAVELAFGHSRSVILLQLELILPSCMAKLAVLDGAFDYSFGERQSRPNSSGLLASFGLETGDRAAEPKRKSARARAGKG
jgi:hypothetical protein